MEHLYNYIFWYNSYEEIWYAIHRDSQLEFFNGSREKSKYLRSKQYNTLVELICKPEILKKYE